MKIKNKAPAVMLVSVLNFFGLLMQVSFSLSLASSSNQGYAGTSSMVIDSISFFWIFAFMINGLYHSKDPYYPAVATTAIAWPAFFTAFFIIGYVASLFGFKLT